MITGADARGVERAVRQVAERFPNVWARGKDRTTIEDVEEDVRTLLGGRSPAGQASTALYKLDKIAADLAGKDLEWADVLVSLESPADGLADFVRTEAAGKIRAGKVDVTIDNRDVEHARNIFTDEFEMASEVDDFWQVLRTKVVPAVKRNSMVALEARLSEPPELRAQIEREARAELLRAGAAPTSTVRVLSAYKQGYSWLYDAVRPALAGKAIESITIAFAEIGAPAEWTQQAMYSPTRWLLERYRRYGHAFDPTNFRMDFTDDVLIYTAIKGERAEPGTRNVTGDDYIVRNPKVTVFFGSTEAPDETAYGDWMKLVATMGLQWDKANLEYLVQGQHVIERKGAPFFGGVTLSMSRARPARPEATTTAGRQ